MEFYEVRREGEVLARRHTKKGIRKEARELVSIYGYVEVWHRGHKRDTFVGAFDENGERS